MERVERVDRDRLDRGVRFEADVRPVERPAAVRRAREAAASADNDVPGVRLAEVDRKRVRAHPVEPRVRDVDPRQAAVLRRDERVEARAEEDAVGVVRVERRSVEEPAVVEKVSIVE